MNIRTTMIATSLFVSSFLVSAPAFAATATPKPSVMMEKTTTTTVTTDEVVQTKVEYTLPYPGILPDHPLYFLKRLRDQIMERLIADPVRKIEFYMLQADKNINMAVFLAAKQNETLSTQVLQEAQGYMDKAVRMAEELKSQGKEVPSYLMERFVNAGAKYQEVLVELATKASETQKASLTTITESIKKLLESVAKLK